MMRKIALLLIAALVAWSGQSFAAPKTTSKTLHLTVQATAGSDPTVGVLASWNDDFANWKLAGVPGGIPNRTTQCGPTLNTVAGMPSGASGDNAHNIVAAIAACTPGQFVLLNPGASAAINITMAANSNTVTINSGTLPHGVGDVIKCVGCQTGMTVTAFQSGSNWTVSFPPYKNLALSSVAATAFIPYNVLLSEAGMFVNKGISIRGGGICSGDRDAPPVCPVDINVSDGAIPEWSVAGGNDLTWCGLTSTAATSGCDPGAGVFMLSSNPQFSWGWGGACNTGTGGSVAGCGSQLAVDVAQGATTVQIASTANFIVGHIALIDEYPVATVTTTNPAGTNPPTIPATSDMFSSSPTPVTNRIANPDPEVCGGFPCGTAYAWSLYPNRVTAELHKISAIGAGPCPGVNCTLTFDSPVSIAFRQSGGHDARVYWPTNGFSTTETPFLAGAGIENLSITRPGTGGIIMEFCQGCWISGVEVGAWFDAGAQVRWSFRSQVTHSWFHHGMNLTNNGIEYPFSIDAGSSEILADDNIFNFGGKGMVARAPGGGNVVANNYFGAALYQQDSIGNYFNDTSVNGSHLAGSHHILFEGNFGNNLDNDDTHGSAGYHTFFRNHGQGYRDVFVDPSNALLTVDDANGIGFATNGTPQSPNPLRAAGSMAWDEWMAFVGNVLGGAGVTTSVKGWSYNTNQQMGPAPSNKGIYALGWAGASFTAIDSHLAPAASPRYVFLHDNYDYLNAAIAESVSGFSHTLPASFYTFAKPSYFTGAACTYPWPWVDSHTAPFLFANSCGGSGLPAKARYLFGTPMITP